MHLFDLDKCFNEVQLNMSKLSKDGKPIYNDGESHEGSKLF